MRKYLTIAGSWVVKHRRQIVAFLREYWQPILYIGGLIVAAAGLCGLIWAACEWLAPQLNPWPTVTAGGWFAYRAGELANRLGDVS